MKIYNVLFTIIFGLAFNNLSFCQSNVTISGLGSDIMFRGVTPNHFSIFDKDTEQHYDQRYFELNFEKGKIFLKDTIYLMNMRYNVFDDFIEVEVKNESTQVLNFNEDLKIELNGMILKNFSSYDLGIVNLIYENKHNNVSLLRKFSKSYKPAEDKSNDGYGTDISKPSRIENNKIRYYIFSDQTNLVELDSRKKILSSIDNPRIKDFIKKNRLKFKNDSDRIELAKFISSMME